MFFEPRDLVLWSFDPKINGFPGLTMGHFCVKFSDPICSGFSDIVRKNRQTNAAENRTPRLPSAWVTCGVLNVKLHWWPVVHCRCATVSHPAPPLSTTPQIKRVHQTRCYLQCWLHLNGLRLTSEPVIDRWLVGWAGARWTSRDVRLWTPVTFCHIKLSTTNRMHLRYMFDVGSA